MSKIKSEKAKEALDKLRFNQANLDYCIANNMVNGDAYINISNIVIIAEAEAEERHAKKIEELTEAQARRIYMIQCDRVNELNAFKNRAMEAINTALCYYGCSKGKYCEDPCQRRDSIIQKLTEKLTIKT